MLNSCTLMGRVTKDPEMRNANGTPVVSFTVACDRDCVSGGEKKVDFIDIVAWRSTAEFVSKYFRKGSMIAIQGHIQTRMYEDKNGNKRKAVEVVADNVSFCGSKNESGTGSSFARDDSFMSAQPAPSYSTADEGDFKEIPEDDLPF